jgi:hypothetical protein
MTTIRSQCAVGLLVLLFFTALSLPCLAKPAAKQISTAELKKRIDENADIVLVNVLPKIIYDEKHLPGSINYPIGRIEDQVELPFPNDKPIIFYCMGVL